MIESTHYSGLTLFRKCPQAYGYKYVARLEASTDQPLTARDFGSWWHAVMAAESLERGREQKSLRYVPEEITTVDDGPTFPGESVTVQDVLEGADKWWRTLSDEHREVWTDWLGQKVPDRLKGLLSRWLDQWREDREHEEVLAVEMPWKRTLPGTETELFGTVDEVYRDTRRGMIVVRDHKTVGDLSNRTAVDDMMDSQLSLYSWGAAPTVTAWGLGKIKAVAYDRVRSIAPKQPQVTASGGLSKSVSAYDLQTYLEWAAGPDGQGVPWGKEGEYFKSGAKKGKPKFGRYTAEEAVVERLSTPVARGMWFQRSVSPLNVNLVKVHLRAAIQSAHGVGETVEQFERIGEAPRNLTRTGCKWCEFADLCRAQMVGGPDGEYDPADYGLQKREEGTR